MIFLDANIILRFILADDPILSPKAKEIFSKIRQEDLKVYVSGVTIAESVYVLLKVYKFKRPEISQTLLPLLLIKQIQTEHKQILKKVFNLFTQKSIDFEDAYILSLMQIKKTKEIFSFDEDFDKFPEIKRMKE